MALWQQAIGSNSNQVQINQNGSYTVVVTDSIGCTGSSDTLHVVNLFTQGLFISTSSPNVYPNPTQNQLFFGGDLYDVTVSTLEGKPHLAANGVKGITVSMLPNGTYLLQLVNQKTGTKYLATFIKQS